VFHNFSFRFKFLPLIPFAAKATREIDDKADQQNQAKAAAPDDGAAKVKAAPEQEQQNNRDQ
jgi:hypothetical protein